MAELAVWIIWAKEMMQNKLAFNNTYRNYNAKLVWAFVGYYNTYKNKRYQELIFPFT
jgi:hypothetical protein